MGTRKADARRNIDATLVASGWLVQNFDQLELSAGRGIAVREFPLELGHDNADYVLYVDGKLVGVVEASLDLWLKDDSLEDSANLPAPDLMAGEIADDLRAALEQFEAIQTDLARSQPK